MNPLEESDIILKDEGSYFVVIANTELGRILQNGRATIRKKEKRQFLREAADREISVFEF